LNKFIELIQAEIRAGTPVEDVLNEMADATVPLITTLSETSELTAAQVIDYFQHRQDTALVNFLQAH